MNHATIELEEAIFSTEARAVLEHKSPTLKVAKKDDPAACRVVGITMGVRFNIVIHRDEAEWRVMPREETHGGVEQRPGDKRV